MLAWLAEIVLGPEIPPPSALPPDVVPPHVVLRRGRLVPWIGGRMSGMGRPAAAVTLGRTIVIDPEAVVTQTLLTHELAHVEQWRRDPLFPLRYSVASLRYGYHDNPYEVEARQFAGGDRTAEKEEERTG